MAKDHGTVRVLNGYDEDYTQFVRYEGSETFSMTNIDGYSSDGLSKKDVIDGLMQLLKWQ